MAYRDDRQALELALNDLQRENEDLREQLRTASDRYRKMLREAHEGRKEASRTSCIMCGGSLLPVAVFAGHDIAAPMPLQMSTLRFGSPNGGFTHAAPVRSMACASCGYLHNFIQMDDSGQPEV